jgi:hypothetical protein
LDRRGPDRRKMVKKVGVRIIRKKRTSRKKKQAIFLKKAGLYCFLAIGTISATLYLLYFSPYFQVEKIEVRNANIVPADDLKKAISDKYSFSMNIFGYQIGSKSILLPFFNSASLLSNFPQVEKLSLSRDFPNMLTLDVKERDPFAVWCKDWDQKQDCSWVDKKGFSFKPYQASDSGDGLVIEEKESFEAMLLEANMDKKGFLAWADKTRGDLNSYPDIGKIVKFSVFTDKIVLKTQKGFEIYFASNGDLAWQMEKLRTVLKEKISSQKITALEYIDLRFGNQAIVK